MLMHMLQNIKMYHLPNANMQKTQNMQNASIRIQTYQTQLTKPNKPNLTKQTHQIKPTTLNLQH